MNVLCCNTPKFSDDEIQNFSELGIKIQAIRVEDVKKEDIDLDSVDMVVGTSFVKLCSPQDFKSIQMIQLSSAGFDVVDVSKIKEQGVMISNASGIYSIPISEWVVGKILDVYKDSRTFYRQLEEKVWKKSSKMQELSDKKVLVFGTGSIGLEIAKRLNPFVMKIAGVNSNGRAVEGFYECFSLQNVTAYLPHYDILIFALPSNGATINYVNSFFLKKCRDDAVLINVGRGTLIDEEALIEELELGRFFSVILDVTQTEPLSADSKLWSYDRLFISPHNSYGSHLIQMRLKELFIQNILNVYHKKEPINLL